VIAQLVVSGLAMAGPYVLFSIAFSLVLKTTGVWNFSQGGVMSLSVYAVYFALNALGWPPVLAVAAGLFVAVAASLAIERFGFEVLRRRNVGSLMLFVFSLVLSAFASDLLTLLFGTGSVTIYPSILSPVHLVAGVAVTNANIESALWSAVLAAAVLAGLKWLPAGQALVAVSKNRELAELYGLSRRRAYLTAAAVSGVLVAVGMYLLALGVQVDPSIGSDLLVVAVAATIIGSIGNVTGTVIGAVLIALLENFSVLVLPSVWQTAVVYGVLFAVIIFLPRGLLASAR
jgi:branched-chain amino acid transport system permease protein